MHVEASSFQIYLFALYCHPGEVEPVKSSFVRVYDKATDSISSFRWQTMTEQEPCELTQPVLLKLQ